jgi:hypothetical protein
MRDERFYGTALILGTVAMLGTGTLHPTGGNLLASAESFAHFAPINVLAHGLALAGVWLGGVGVVGLSRRLGTNRPDVTAALVAYGLATVAVSIAAVTDGIVSTRLAEAYVASDVDADRKVLRGFMQYSYNIASSLSRYYVSAVAVAMLLWSWAAWRTRFAVVLPWIGAVVAVVGLVAQLSGHLRMNTHDVLLLAVGQGIWMVAAGVALLRAPAPKIT